jgi:hypothetical protein
MLLYNETDNVFDCESHDIVSLKDLPAVEPCAVYSKEKLDEEESAGGSNMEEFQYQV